MKFVFALVLSFVGFVVIAADQVQEESLESRLEMMLKTLMEKEPKLKSAEELELEARDSLRDCQRDTGNCGGHGTCQQSAISRRHGHYICICDSNYRLNMQGGCSPMSEREVAYLASVARDVELEMLARDSMRDCIRDTDGCDGHGNCTQSVFGRTTGQYICACDDGYRNNLYGGCSPRTKREMEYLEMMARDQELELQTRDTIMQCERDTKKCDGHGDCIQSAIGRGFICSCDDDFKNNLYGGCSPVAAPRPKESPAVKSFSDEQLRQLDLLRELANLMDE